LDKGIANSTKHLTDEIVGTQNPPPCSADIRAIERNLYDYARGIDRKQWEWVRESYHPDAYDNHGAYKGDIDGFLAYLQQRHATIERSIHLVSNVVIDFLDDHNALCESYFSARQRLADAGDGAVDNHSIGRYLDHVQKRDGRWRVLHRDVVFDFYSSNPARDSDRLSGSVSRSQRDNTDLLFEKRRRLGFDPAN
jgi:hypothetical protein